MVTKAFLDPVTGNTNNLNPVYYRVSIDSSVLPTPPALQTDPFDNEEYGFIDNKKTEEYMHYGYELPTGSNAFRDVMIKERGFARWVKLLQKVSENIQPLHELEIQKTFSFGVLRDKDLGDTAIGPSSDNPLLESPTVFEVTFKWDRDEYVYTRNVEGVAGTTNPASTEIFFGEEAVNRMVARALAEGIGYVDLVYDPTEDSHKGALNPIARDKTKNLEVVAAAIASDLTNAQNAVTVNKLELL